MTDPVSMEFHLSPSPSGEFDAEEALGKALAGGSAVLLDRAMRLISPLVATNRVRAKGDATIAVKVFATARTVRVEIRDGGTGVVLGGLGRRDGSASDGLSPHFLSRIADRWGLVSGADGAWVWFELDLPGGSG